MLIQSWASATWKRLTSCTPTAAATVQPIISNIWYASDAVLPVL